jgi:DNA-binding transcriptional ArsR family regulator
MSSQPLIRAIDPAALAKAADVIKVVGHPDRLRILEFLEEGERCVGEIQEVLELPQAIVSQHLAKMRGWNIVESRREGTHVFYHIIEPKVRHILDCIRHCDIGEAGARESRQMVSS